MRTIWLALLLGMMTDDEFMKEIHRLVVKKDRRLDSWWLQPLIVKRQKRVLRERFANPLVRR